MASILNVDQINNAAGTSGIALDASTGKASFPNSVTIPNGATMPAGSVLQVVQAIKSNETSTSSTSFVDTGLSKSITPTSSSSKIMITLDMPTRSNNMGVSLLVRYSTDGGSTYSDVSIAGNQNNWGHAAGYTAAGTTANWSHVTKNFVHSPSTASTITYKVQYKGVGSGANCIICDSSDAAILTLTEIAG